jgi:hypothetical protein
LDNPLALWNPTNTPFPNFTDTPATPSVPATGTLPAVPALQSIEGYISDVTQGLGANNDPNNKIFFDPLGINAAGVGAANATASAFNIVTDPVRVITVVVGLIFMAGGLYIFGTSSITDALRKVAK